MNTILLINKCELKKIITLVMTVKGAAKYMLCLAEIFYINDFKIKQ